MKTPILFIIFNRPDTTKKVFETIRNAKPKRLFIAADGPRPDRPDDKSNCELTRKVTENIDWDCEAKRLYQDKNLGCGYGVSTAISWFFDNVEQGIILEDDCVPDPSFFRFCEELLEYYKDDPRIMHIGGNNFQDGIKRGNASYYFSEFPHIWGWASWRRAWKKYDFDCLGEEYKKNNWDKQWLVSVRKQQGLAIVPNINLVSNIGFGKNATHTTELSRISDMETEEMSFPLVNPKRIRREYFADIYTYRNIFGGSYFKLIIGKILGIIPKKIKTLIKKLL